MDRYADPGPEGSRGRVVADRYADPGPEGSKGARSWIATRIRDFQDSMHVLADAARSGSSNRIKICLSGWKDRFGIDKTTGKPTARNNF